MKVEALSTVVAALESGKRPKGGASGDSGTIPSLGGEHLNNDGGFRFDNLKYIDEQFFVDLKKGTIKTNDILIVKDGATTGKVSYVGSDFPFGRAAINEHLFSLTVDASVANPHYVFSFLKSPQGQKEILKDFRGAAIGGISRGFVDLVQIPLPLLDDQIRIAHLLGKVERLIAQRKQHLSQLDNLLKSVFLEMFGDPVRNEKGWEKKTAIDYADCIVPGRDKPKSFSGGTPWVTTGDLRHLGYTEKSRSEIGLSEDEIKEVRARVVPKSSVLLTCVGDLGVVSICASGMVINQQLHSFQVSEVMTEEFFMYSLSFQKKYMYQNASQTTLPYMNKTICNKIPMIRPPKDLQIKFSETVKTVCRIKSNCQESLTDLEALYGALSQRAFKGDLDLSRVPMPGNEPDEEKTVVAEPLHAPAEQNQAIHLPDTDNLLAALESAEAREGLIAQWLEAYRSQLGSTPFSVQHFMAAAQIRLAELHPDDNFKLGASDYDCIKTWVFEALAAGTLKQAFDDTGNRIVLKTVQA